MDYTVVAGDTLASIADAHAVPGGWEALAALNGLADPDALDVGQVLKLLGAGGAVGNSNGPVVPVYTAGVINATTGAISAVVGKSVPAPLGSITSVPVAPSAFVEKAADKAVVVPARVAPVVSAGLGLAARAVAAAVAQVGTPYVYGGAAPGAFDCSGLVQWAFKHVGIQLPRTAAAQAGVGRLVSRDQLQPGDLLLYYSPIEHVVMYIGGGKIVEASQPGVPVHVRPVYWNGFVEARRVV